MAAPSQLLLLAMGVGALLLWTRYRRAGRLLVSATSLFGVAVTILPIGPALIRPLEERFPVPHELPGRVDGIVVLGGAIRPNLSEKRGQVSLNKHAERFLEAAVLARRYPTAEVIFSGGSASLAEGSPTEAQFAPSVFAGMAMPADRIRYENRSRNTCENALFTKRLANPQEGQTWLLITSAKHMPRAVGCFRRVDFPVIPYPVDFETSPQPDGWQRELLFSSSLVAFDEAVREWLGLLMYRVSGCIAAVFPGPDG